MSALLLARDNLRPVDSQTVLATLAHVPISTWNYTTQDPGIVHVGLSACFSAAIRHPKERGRVRVFFDSGALARYNLALVVLPGHGTSPTFGKGWKASSSGIDRSVFS